jgi:hypothetical protein
MHCDAVSTENDDLIASSLQWHAVCRPYLVRLLAKVGRFEAQGKK